MVVREASISKESAAQKECRHYWIIETAAGPVSDGTCKFCGAQRGFNNYLPDCLEVDEERYEEWISRQRYNKEERKLEENIFSRLGKANEEVAEESEVVLKGA